MYKILLVVFLLNVAGCSNDLEFTEVPIGEILNETSKTVYLQVVIKDDYEGAMERVIKGVKSVKYVKNVEYVRSQDADYMSFWIPVTIGGDGKDPKAISIFYSKALSPPEIGLVMNGKWADQFPRSFMSNVMLLNLCNDSSKSFISASSFSAAFDGWPSTYKRALFSQGKCMETALSVRFNAPYIERDTNGVRLLEFRGFLLEQ